MKIGIFHFSGTGNTYFVANTLKKHFKSKGHLVDILAIENHLEDDESNFNYDIIGIGYPIYGSDVPKIVNEWVNRLPVLSQRIFIFCTQMMYSGDGANYIGKRLRKREMVVHQQAHFNMPNNITDIKIFKPGKHLTEKQIEKLNNNCQVFAHKILDDQISLKGSSILSLFLGLVQRFPFQRLEKQIFDSSIKLEDTCVLCGKCVEICPVKNFEISEGKLKTNNSCILCYRCVNNCPKLSLHISRKRKVIYPYKGPTEEFVIKSVMIDELDT